MQSRTDLPSCKTYSSSRPALGLARPTVKGCRLLCESYSPAIQRPRPILLNNIERLRRLFMRPFFRYRRPRKSIPPYGQRHT